MSEQVSASRKLQAEAALELLERVDEVYASKGKNVVYFRLSEDRPDKKTLLSHLLGAAGNLRAPTVIKDRTLLVGFNQETFERVFGRIENG